MHSQKNIGKQLKKNPVVFFVFDVPLANGNPIDHKRWIERRGILKKIMKKIPGFRISSAITEGSLLFEAARRMGLEGIMMKRIDAPYYVGQRSDAWQKLKFRLDILKAMEIDHLILDHYMLLKLQTENSNIEGELEQDLM